MKIKIVICLGLLMAISLLGSETITVNQGITIPDGTDYLLALCSSHDGNLPPYVNGVEMKTIVDVAEQGEVPGISCHFMRYPLTQLVPAAMNGADVITFMYWDEVKSVGNIFSGYEADGSTTGDLTVDTAHEVVSAIAVGLNGQVTIQGDGGSFTAIYDTTNHRVGHKTPGDATLTCLSTDGSAGSGYWYYPPPVWVDTSTSVLVEAGHYEFTSVRHYTFWAYVNFSSGTYNYRAYRTDDPGDPNYPPGTYILPAGFSSPTYLGSNPSYSGLPSIYYTYPATWVPDRYETVSSGYWSYPDPVFIGDGTPGQVSCIYIALSDVEPPSSFIPRPLMG